MTQTRERLIVHSSSVPAPGDRFTELRVAQEQATVWRTPISRRRYFTLKPALRRHFRDLLRASGRCDCEEPENNVDFGRRWTAPGHTCRYHADEGGLRRTQDRAVGIWLAFIRSGRVTTPLAAPYGRAEQ